MPAVRRYVTQAEFARIMGVTDSEVIQSAKRKRIRTMKRGGRKMIDLKTQGPLFISTMTKAPPPRAFVRCGIIAKPEEVSGAGPTLRDLGLGLTEPDDVRDSNSIVTSRQISEKYKAQKAKLDYERASGEVVDISLVLKEWVDIATQLRKSILGIPDRLTPLVAAETDPKRCWAVLDSECRVILEDIVDSIERSQTTKDPS